MRLVIATLALATACGGSNHPPCPANASPISHEQSLWYDALQRDLGLSAPPPLVAYGTSQPCPPDPTKSCLPGSPAVGARYIYWCSTIELQSAYATREIFRHEATHHLLYVNDQPQWAGHCSPEMKLVDPSACSHR